MEILHDFWNQRNPPEDLISVIEQRNSPQFTKDIFYSLLKIFSTFSTPDSLITDYLKSLCINYPDLFINLLSADNFMEFSKPIIHLLRSIEPQLLDAFEYKDEEAICIFHLLRLFIQLPNKDLSVETLFDLCQEFKFPSLFAFMRTKYENEIQSIRSEYQSFIQSHPNQAFFSIPVTLLNKSICADLIVDPHFFNQNQFLPFLFSILTINQSTDTFSHLLNPKIQYQHLTFFISLYLNNASYLLLYLIIAWIPNLNRQNFSQFLTIQKKLNRQNSFPYSLEFIESTFLNSGFITREPKDLLQNLFFRNQSTITRFADDILESTKNETFNKFLDILDPLNKTLNELIVFLSLNNKFTDFLVNLILFCEQTSNDKEFQRVWFFLLNLVHRSYSSGLCKIQQAIQNALDKVSIHAKFFFLTLINYKTPDLNIVMDTPDTFFLKCVSILQKLLSATSDLVFDFTMKYCNQPTTPTLWPSILLACIVRPQVEFKILFQETKMPNFPIVATLLYHFRIIINNLSQDETTRSNYNQSLIMKPHYLMMMHFPLKAIEDIREPIRRHFCQMKSLIPDCNFLTAYTDIFTCWKVWLNTYPPIEFIKELFFGLALITFSILDPKEYIPYYKNAAFMLYLVCDGNQKEIFPHIFTEINRQVNEVIQNMGQALGLAHFVHSFISLSENWEEFFDSVYNLSTSILADFSIYPDQSLKMNFAITFIRQSLLTPILQKKVVDGPFDYLVALNDYKTLIDYFIVKAKLADNVNNSSHI